MKLKHFYLVLAVIGFVGPYYFLITFLAAHGLDGRAFLQQLFGTHISTFFAVDLIIASIVFIVYLPREAKRYSIHSWWLYLIPLFVVGLSFALPLFLYVREDHPERGPSARLVGAAKSNSSLRNLFITLARSPSVYCLFVA